MALVLVLVTLLGTPAFGDPDNFNYPANCAPPLGFVSNDTALTTPDYVTLRPIERCCPQCDQCADLGGYCALKWAVDLYPQSCDFALVDSCKDYSCKCCIKCGGDKCSSCVETGGECRGECRAGELEDTRHVCSYHNNGSGCKCCKKCEEGSECTHAEGICVTDPDYCPDGTFASTGCCGRCYCCKPVLIPNPQGGCDAPGAYCSETSDCAIGFYSCFGACIKTVFVGGLQSADFGFCCLPKQTASPAAGRIEALPFLMNQQQDIRKHPRQLLD